MNLKRINKERSYFAVGLVIAAVGISGSASAQPTQISLEQAIGMAESYAPAIDQAEANLKAQKSRTTASYLNLGPKLNGEYSRAILENEKTANFGGATIVIAPKETRTAALTLSQPITGLFGLANLARFEGRRAELEEQKYSLTKATLRFQTAEVFLLARSAVTMRKVAEDAVKASQKQVADAKSLLSAGRIHKGDLLKLELALSNASADLANAKAAEVRIKAQLLSIIGLPLDSDVVLESPKAIPLVPNAQNIEDIIKARKDIKSAELGVDIASYSKLLAASDFMPSINVFGRIDYNLLEPQGLGSSSKKSKTYGVQATWLLWNNGTRVFKMREAAFQTHAAEAGFKQAVDMAKVEIVSAKADYDASKEAVELAKTAAEQAREAYRIEQVKFKAGDSGGTELVLAESANALAEGNNVAASANFEIKILKLQKACGFDKPMFGGAK